MDYKKVPFSRNSATHVHWLCLVLELNYIHSPGTRVVLFLGTKRRPFFLIPNNPFKRQRMYQDAFENILCKLFDIICVYVLVYKWSVGRTDERLLGSHHVFAIRWMYTLGGLPMLNCGRRLHCIPLYRHIAGYIVLVLLTATQCTFCIKMFVGVLGGREEDY